MPSPFFTEGHACAYCRDSGLRSFGPWEADFCDCCEAGKRLMRERAARAPSEAELIARLGEMLAQRAEETTR